MDKGMKMCCTRHQICSGSVLDAWITSDLGVLSCLRLWKVLGCGSKQLSDSCTHEARKTIIYYVIDIQCIGSESTAELTVATWALMRDSDQTFVSCVPDYDAELVH